MSSAMRKFWGGPPAAADSAWELEKLVPRVQEVCTQPLAASLTEQGARRLLRDAMSDLGHRMRDMPEQVRAPHLVDHVRHRFRRILDNDPFELFAINESGLEGPQEAGSCGDQARAVAFTVWVPRHAAEVFPADVSAWITSQCASMGYPVDVEVAQGSCDAMVEDGQHAEGHPLASPPLDALGASALEERCSNDGDDTICVGEFVQADDLEVYGTSAAAVGATPAQANLTFWKCNRRRTSPVRHEAACHVSTESTDLDVSALRSALAPLAVEIDSEAAAAVFSREALVDPSLSRVEAAVRDSPRIGAIAPSAQGWGRWVWAREVSTPAAAQAHCVVRVLPAQTAVPQQPASASSSSAPASASITGMWAIPAALVALASGDDSDAPQSDGALCPRFARLTVTPGESVPSGEQAALECLGRKSARKVCAFSRRLRLPAQEWLPALLDEIRIWFPDTFLAVKDGNDSDEQHFLACGLGKNLVRQWLLGMVVFPFSGEGHPGFVGEAVRVIEQNLGCSTVFISGKNSCLKGARFMPDVVPERCVRTSSAEKEHLKGNLVDGRADSYWQSDSPTGKNRAVIDTWHWFEIHFPDECCIFQADMLCGSHSSNFDPTQVRVQVGRDQTFRTIRVVDCSNPEKKEWVNLIKDGEVLRTSTLRISVISKGKNVRVNAIRVSTSPLGRGCTQVGVIGPVASRTAVVAALEAERSVCERAVRATPGAIAVLRAHAPEFVRRTGVRAIKLPEGPIGVVRLVGTAGPQGTITSCRRELERLIRFQAQVVQRERIASMRQEIASSLSHVEVHVPLSPHMHELLRVSAFAKPALGASGPGRPRPGSVGILDAVKAQTTEARAQNRDRSSIVGDLRRRMIERVSEGGGLMERIMRDGDEEHREGNMLALMLRELRPRLEEPDFTDINVRAFTLWTQLEEYACDKIDKQIIRSAGLFLPDDWGTRSAVASMHPGLEEGQHIRYFRGGDLGGRQLEGRVVRVAPGVTAQGKARAELDLAAKAWLGATLEGTCADPGRPTLATLVLEGDLKLHNLATRAVHPAAKTSASLDAATAGPKEKEQVEVLLAAAAVAVIGLKWAALMDEFLLAELGAVLRADVATFVDKGVSLQALYDAADRSRHRLLEMLAAAERCAQGVHEQLADVERQAYEVDGQPLAEAAKSLTVQVRDTAASWAATIQRSEHDAVRLAEGLVERIEEANDQHRLNLSSWDRLREVSHASGAFVTYNPPGAHLLVKGREAQVRDAVRRLRSLMLEDAGRAGRDVSINLSQAAAAQLGRNGGIMLRLIELQAGLEHAQLDAAGVRLKIRGGNSQLARAAQLLGSLVPSIEDSDADNDLACVADSCTEGRNRCLVCLDSTPPLMELLCGHQCHPECFQKDHEAKMKSSREVGTEEPFRCPASAALQGAGGCSHVLTTSEVLQAFGGGPAVLKHFEILVDSKLRARPDKRSCTECGALAVAASDDTMPLSCAECGASFCGSRGDWCGKRAHYFCSCEQFAQARVAKLRRRGECDDAATLQQNLRPSSQWPDDVVLCARCRCPIDRQEGANQDCKYMRCRLCAYEFCWYCLQPADNHRHINPANPRETPECDNLNNQFPENRERRRKAIIEGGCDAVRVPLPRSQVVCDRCGKREGLGKVFACLECLNSYLCESCEPEGCVSDAMHVVDELELVDDESTCSKPASDEKGAIPDGFWKESPPQVVAPAIRMSGIPLKPSAAVWGLFHALTGIERPMLC